MALCCRCVAGVLWVCCGCIVGLLWIPRGAARLPWGVHFDLDRARAVRLPFDFVVGALRVAVRLTWRLLAIFVKIVKNPQLRICDFPFPNMLTVQS